jgi:acetyl-CoA C-acetyltransferase
VVSVLNVVRLATAAILDRAVKAVSSMGRTVALDPRTPVLVGVGQWSNRVDRGEPVVEPADLIAGALRRAADDSGVGARLLGDADAVWTVALFSRRYRNPAALVAERLGARPRDTAVSPVGGNEPQVLVAQACRAVAAGRADLVLIGGAEAWRSRQRAKAEGLDLGWTYQSDDVPPARLTGDEMTLNHPAELARGLAAPTQLYPLFEQALRHAAGRSIHEHLVFVSELWAGFAAVAAGNPHAWIRDAPTAEQIRTPSADNRWICWPYTKLMNANNAVEQGAGIIVCSVERAVGLGVPRDRWVFPLVAVQAHDSEAVSHRAGLRSSPAIRLAGRRLLALAGRDIDDVAHVDLYSCFPSAVQITATELGLGLDRQLTVTGGLSFAGGPWNNYVAHAIAAMAQVLRADPGSLGLVTANGGHVTKHALGLYSTEPPPGGFRWADVQDEVDALPRRGLCERPDGPATIESWVVQHDRDGARERVFAACLLDDGRRAWATSDDADVVAELRSGAEQIGRPVKLTPDGNLLL